MKLKLRPHHLLCMQGYAGKGYSDDFVENMTAITTYLQNNTNALVEIVFSTDDICSKCPQMLGIDLCEDNGKVKRFDKKVIDYLGLEEKNYLYQDITCEINSKMTTSIMDDICFDCSWYPVSACKDKILGQ